ncbi:ketopantoate reductase family protein [Marisediminicola senii]|uniref:ketopantoate reductase family protein n=1 Tax=Marisediminicola senii TaxID=2711233 RepID=UPI0013EBF1C6|nr:2-dehydropantoate 2-reductase [Marisediminicola senii]
MRVAVIGAGAVGGTIAALLARAGHDVEATARGEHLAAMRADGLRLRGAYGDYTARIAASGRVTARPELAFVTTKAQDAAAAIGASAGLLARIPVVVVQNGLQSIDGARAALPHSPLVGGLALFAASHLEPGVVDVTARGSLVLGSDRGDRVAARAAAGLITRALGDDLPVSVVDDFAGAQWTKLLINQVNALPAITGLSVQEVVADRRLRRIMTASMREAAEVGLARGIHFASMQGLSDRLVRAFRFAPSRVAQLLPVAMARRMGDVPNPGSTLQSIRRGQATEIDYLNGAIVDAAGATGIAVPVNRVMVDLVHEVELRGGFTAPAEVLARVQQESAKTRRG